MLVAGLALVVGSGRAGGGRQEEPLREELLKLNQATTEDLQNAKFRALMKDREKAKKAVAEAVKMMKEAREKEKPFNYNGTLILGRTASRLKEYDAAEKFYEHQVEHATKLKSGTKMRRRLREPDRPLHGLEALQRRDRACEKFMDLTGPEEVENAQAVHPRAAIQAKARSGKTDEAMNIAKGMVAKTGEPLVLPADSRAGSSARRARSTRRSRPTTRCSTSSTATRTSRATRRTG